MVVIRLLAMTTVLLSLNVGVAAGASDVIYLSQHAPGSFVEVASGSQLVIDTSGIDSEASQLIVLQCNNAYYATPLQPERSRYTLNTATLKAYDAPPFKELSMDDSVYLMIGQEPSPGALSKGMFLPNYTWYLQVK